MAHRRCSASSSPARCSRSRARSSWPAWPDAIVIGNRSLPTATVIPVLVYPDVRAAVAWLTEAFGFVERVRVGEDHRSQMQIGDDGAVIVADVRREQQPPAPGTVTHVI